ncbi:hypothetical protein ACFY3U_13175 [Micromonospora sp. NPDC000089]|uniref:hypothetical protein n=1 Tax=unclassified Micromonospora TaxID=2617518 RepID=UPI0036BF4513
MVRSTCTACALLDTNGLIRGAGGELTCGDRPGRSRTCSGLTGADQLRLDTDRPAAARDQAGPAISQTR